VGAEDGAICAVLVRIAGRLGALDQSLSRYEQAKWVYTRPRFLQSKKEIPVYYSRQSRETNPAPSIGPGKAEIVWKRVQ
jgi:hypothetical protein